MRRRTAILAALSTAGLALSACSGAPASPGGRGYASNATFTMAVTRDLGTFDPYHSQLVFSYLTLAYDSLVNLQPDGKIVSGLAANWQADANSATFTLRPEITCSDGTPLTASQVVADLNYLKDPNNHSPLYGVFVPSAPFTAAADDTSRTVKIAMQNPHGFLLRTIGLTPIACAKGLKDPSVFKTSSNGTGPFVLSQVVPGQSYTFTKRAGYTWGPGGASTAEPGTPGKVVLKIVPNETTAANLLSAGGLNAALIAGPDQQRLESQGLDHRDLRGTASEVWFNQRDGRPTADLKVRQALISALDFSRVVRATGSTGKPATGLVNFDPKPCTGDTVTGQLPAPGASVAEALLNQAGWTKGADGTRSKNGKVLKLNLNYPSTLPLYAPVAELIAQEWKSVGVQVKLTAENATTMSQTMFQTGNFDVYLDGFGFTLPDQVAPYVTGKVPPQGTNFTGIDNAEYSRLATRAGGLTGAEACAVWNQAEQALIRNVDVVPISTAAAPMFLDKAVLQVTGFQQPIPTTIRMLG